MRAGACVQTAPVLQELQNLRNYINMSDSKLGDRAIPIYGPRTSHPGHIENPFIDAVNRQLTFANLTKAFAEDPIL